MLKETSDSLLSIIARITLCTDLATIQVQPSLISNYITHAGIQAWNRAFRSSWSVRSDAFQFISERYNFPWLKIGFWWLVENIDSVVLEIIESFDFARSACLIPFGWFETCVHINIYSKHRIRSKTSPRFRPIACLKKWLITLQL